MSAFGGPNIITDGLVMYVDALNPKCYPGTGTSFIDLVNPTNVGTLVNGTTFQAGKGFVFDGVDDYATLPHLDVYNTYGTTNEITVLATYYWDETLDATVESYTGIIDKGGYNVGFGAIYKAANQSGSQYNMYINKTSGAIQRPTSGLSTVNFNYAGFTSTSTNLSTYLNGVFQGANTFSASTLNTSTAEFTFGKRATHPYYHYGPIVSLQMYNKALSASEVLQNYNATKTRFGL